MTKEKAFPYYHIKSVEKVSKILELLSEEGELSVSEIGKKMGIHRSAVHRFLATLRNLGFLEQSEDSRYRLSFKLFELGINAVNRLEVRETAHSFLMDLGNRYQETTFLGVRQGTDVVFIDKIESPNVLRMDVLTGWHVPAYCTALGKMILSDLPEKEIIRLFSKVKFERPTPKTITTAPELIRQLRKIREQGFSIDDEELALGLRCVAAPIFNYTGRCIAAISLSGPTVRMANERLEEMKQALIVVSKTISIRLGSVELESRR